MSATKNFLHDYNEALDAAWIAIEEALSKVGKLNDLLYTEDGELLSRAPSNDVWLLRQKVRELNGEIACYMAAEEPSRTPPVLPFEKVHYEK